MPFLRSAYPYSDQLLPSRCEMGRMGRHGVEHNVLGYRDRVSRGAVCCLERDYGLWSCWVMVVS